MAAKGARESIILACSDCKRRLEVNPLRILDCKVPEDIEIVKGAPKMTEYLSPASKAYLQSVISILNSIGIETEVDTNLVRGLDYYTGVVFEYHFAKTEGLDNVGALGGGGTLASNRTITHNTSGVTAGSAGPTADVSGANAISVPRITVDEYGHITALSSQTYTGVAAASNGRMTISANGGTAVNTLYTANVSSATNAINFVQGTGITTAVTAYSNSTPAKVTITHANPGTGTDLAATNTDTTTYTNGGEYTVVTGVTVTKDSLGHVTGLKETRQTIKSSIATPASPGAGVLQVVANNGTSGVATPFTANVGSNTIGLNFINGTHTTAVVTAVSGKAPTITFNHNSAGTGSAMTTTNGDAAAASAGTSYDVLTGVTISKDSLGHITGVSTTRQKVVSDSHHQAKNVVATTNAKTADEATANTTTFLNLVENGSVRSSHQIKGAGSVSVASTAAGVITITGTTYTNNVTTSAFVANASNASAATAAGTTIDNGSLYYILREGSTNTATLITGSGGTTVTKDGNGTNRIIITSPEVAEITEAEINTVCVI